MCFFVSASFKAFLKLGLFNKATNVERLWAEVHQNHMIKLITINLKYIWVFIYHCCLLTVGDACLNFMHMGVTPLEFTLKPADHSSHSKQWRETLATRSSVGFVQRHSIAVIEMFWDFDGKPQSHGQSNDIPVCWLVRNCMQWRVSALFRINQHISPRKSWGIECSIRCVV